MRTDTMCHYWEEALDWEREEAGEETEEDDEKAQRPRVRVDGQSPLAD